MLLAGTLDRSIIIQRQTVEPDPDYGSDVTVWTDLLAVRARFDPKGTSETIKSDTAAESTQVDARFIIRYPPQTLNSKDRVLFNNSVWDITGVKEIQRGRVLELNVKRSPEHYPERS